MSLLNEYNNIDNNPQLQLTIKNNAKKIVFNKDDIIIKSGEKIQYVYYLISGRVKLTSYCEDGSIEILQLLGKGCLIGSNPILRGKDKTDINVICEKTCQVYAIKIDTFFALIDSSNIFRNYIIKDLACSKHSTVGNYYRLKNTLKEEILYNFFIINIDSSKSIDECWYAQNVNYTQQELADLIGVSRITITTLIKKLCTEEKIRKINNELYVKIKKH